MRLGSPIRLLNQGAVFLLCLWTLNSAQVYRPLFNGTSLKGWHPQGTGTWRVVDGMIEGTHTTGTFGHLVSDSSFDNFRLRWKWKLSAGGNSGLYFHSQEGEPQAGLAGVQVEMDDSFSGGIYSTATNPWGWVAQPTAANAKTWTNIGDWNEVVLVVNGNRATITMNGIKATDTVTTKLGAPGHFGFQVHANIAMTLLVKDVEISEVPGTTGVTPPFFGSAKDREEIKTSLSPYRAIWQAHGYFINGSIY
jgi:hypothetical protein